MPGTETRHRVLLVEDEPSLGRGLTDNFKDEGYEVCLVARGDDAIRAVRDFGPNVMVLDIMLPGRSGLDVLRDLRASGRSLPVVMLTAKADVVDRVVGLELGADDYVSKPFAIQELLARVRAVLRRASDHRASLDELVVGNVRFDFRGRTATGLHGDSVDLSDHDIVVMRVLAERRGDVVPRIDIVEEVCGMESEATLRTVDNHIMALRRAIGDDPKHPRWLHTVRGEGYRFARG